MYFSYALIFCWMHVVGMEDWHSPRPGWLSTYHSVCGTYPSKKLIKSRPYVRYVLQSSDGLWWEWRLGILDWTARGRRAFCLSCLYYSPSSLFSSLFSSSHPPTLLYPHLYPSSLYFILYSAVRYSVLRSYPTLRSYSVLRPFIPPYCSLVY